jgi:hypothetical protein
MFNNSVSETVSTGRQLVSLFLVAKLIELETFASAGGGFNCLRSTRSKQTITGIYRTSSTWFFFTLELELSMVKSTRVQRSK